MPDREPVVGQSTRKLIWAAVVLATMASAIALLGHGSVAVLLIAVSVILIGVVLIRLGPPWHPTDVEDRVAGQMAVLRRELRAEFATGGVAHGGLASGGVAHGGVAHGLANGGVAHGGAGGPTAPPPAGSGFLRGQPAEASSFSDGLIRDQPGRPGPLPRQRGTASVPSVASVPPGDYAVGSGTTYGRPVVLGGDFAAGPSHVDISGGYPSAGTTYGSKGTAYGSPAERYDADDYGYGGHRVGGYGGAYAPTAGGNADGGPGPAGYDQVGARYAAPVERYAAPVEQDAAPVEQGGGDPDYRARRHRPSANDTSVGSLADFASYGGYSEPPPAEQYVPDYEGASRYWATPAYGSRPTYAAPRNRP